MIKLVVYSYDFQLMTEISFLEAHKKALIDLNFQLFNQLMKIKTTPTENKDQPIVRHDIDHGECMDHAQTTNENEIDRPEQNSSTDLFDSNIQMPLNSNDNAIPNTTIADKKFVYMLVDNEKSEAVRTLLNNVIDTKKKLKSDFRALKEYSFMKGKKNYYLSVAHFYPGFIIITRIIQ